MIWVVYNLPGNSSHIRLGLISCSPKWVTDNSCKQSISIKGVVSPFAHLFRALLKNVGTCRKLFGFYNAPYCFAFWFFCIMSSTVSKNLHTFAFFKNIYALNDSKVIIFYITFCRLTVVIVRVFVALKERKRNARLSLQGQKYRVWRIVGAVHVLNRARIR
jgi:hypothetical protein